MANIPDRPALDGIEDRWIQQWEADGTYRFDRSVTLGELRRAHGELEPRPARRFGCGPRRHAELDCVAGHDPRTLHRVLQLEIGRAHV